MASSAPSSAYSRSGTGRGSATGSRKTTPSSAGKAGKKGSLTCSSDSSIGKLTAAHPRPSAKLNPKTVDPFKSPAKNQSAFAAVYTNGGVPCRLFHGSVKHKLAWDTSPEQVPFDPILVTLAEGLKESVHPYMFVARTGFKELLEVEGATGKVSPILPKVCIAVRAALSHAEGSVFESALDALLQLSEVAGPLLNQHLKLLIVPIAKRMMEKKHRDRITEALQTLEQNGGKEALPSIKSKVPTYSSIFG
ncbi:PACRG-like protein [Mizuhopecten yessoensis]|uniref:PACRG-like protein n=1 Tax=Mizuhopecten yessoensis TaxID=6573 RepID=A0A210Q559_MIZYE|nr:PACRG-like protein [Mizuhopecten yessoensis]OWF43867.1 PACRG-like protein [Mizuhopecten yessoensis]